MGCVNKRSRSTNQVVGKMHRRGGWSYSASAQILISHIRGTSFTLSLLLKILWGMWRKKIHAYIVNIRELFLFLHCENHSWVISHLMTSILDIYTMSSCVPLQLWDVPAASSNFYIKVIFCTVTQLCFPAHQVQSVKCQVAVQPETS